MIPQYLQNLADELKRRKESKFKYNITELLRMEIINTELRGYLNKAKDVLKEIKWVLKDVEHRALNNHEWAFGNIKLGLVPQLEEEIKFIQGVLK